MRFERLELAPYGGYERRALDFGDGRPDLHLIIGPNEAGKSTLLAAIGDLLFGFRRPTAQDWRFESKDLRIAATLNHDGGALSIVRRSGLKNTLLGPDGAAIADESLGESLGGLDRSAFDRLYGLDHAKLRAGGQAILAGKDDAAQSLFEAGTGMAAVGARLRDLEAECAELFKPSASKPKLNQLLRERAEAMDRLRRNTLGDAEWTGLRERRSAAEQARADLIAEDARLAARLNHLERLARARAPLRRLAQARGELEQLGSPPALPASAAETLAAARAERATTAELRANGQRKLDQAGGQIAAIDLPEAILAAATRIDELEARRPETDRMRRDLPAKAADLERIEAALAAVRQTAGLAAAAPLPATSWRRRVRKYLEDRRALETRLRKTADLLGENARDSKSTADALAEGPETATLHTLQEALSTAPSDIAERVESARAAAERAAKRAATALAQLGWVGTAEALATAFLPSVAEASEHDERARRADEALNRAIEAAAVATADSLRLRAQLDELSSGGELPTPTVVAASREARDQLLEVVRARLEQPRGPRDEAVAVQLTLAIGRADLLADARDAASRRIAEHALATTALTVAEGGVVAADAAMLAARESAAHAQADWSEMVARCGLPETLRPSGFAKWAEARVRFLELRDDADTAAQAHRRELDALRSADTRLADALAGCGLSADGDFAVRHRGALGHAARLEAAARVRTTLVAKIADLDRAAQSLAAEREAAERAGVTLDEARARLLAETGIVAATDERLEDILEGLDEVTPQAGARPGLAQDVNGMKRDITAFDADASALLTDLGRSPTGSPSDAVRRLAVDLETARGLRRDQQRLRADVVEETAEMENVEQRHALAQSAIDHLLARAGVATEEQLDHLLVVLEKQARATSAEATAIRELDEIADNLGFEALAAAAADVDSAAAAVEREGLEARRREIAEQRESTAAELKEVLLAIERAGTVTDAADAQQEAAELRAALGAGAERYIEAAASAALLRWLVERHRAGAQAPLLVRAGALFATVTRGAFQGVALDYGDDDRPRIVAVRTGGARVGIEGLSEGARDQLYLALRLGSLQIRPGRSALPLVCDDLLVTSDDERAAAVLRVLANTAESLQVLVFTHHDHIEDVARRALGPGGFRVHRLAA